MYKHLFMYKQFFRKLLIIQYFIFILLFDSFINQINERFSSHKSMFKNCKSLLPSSNSKFEQIKIKLLIKINKNLNYSKLVAVGKIKTRQQKFVKKTKNTSISKICRYRSS